jgi:C1A family cysteine protease
MSYKISRYGWLPDLPDHRDDFYAVPIEWAAVLPASTDLRPQCPPVYDQGQLGSCTANAIAGAIQFDRLKQRLAQIFIPSRLFVYYNERAIGGHAVGYHDAKQWFIVPNSWGNQWGIKGYFTLPYAYLTDENLASDFWTIRVVQ